MFDIGFLELLLLAIIGLLVLGPERLPETVRTISLWLGRLRRGFDNLRTEIEREVGADEIKRQLHNERVMESLKKTQQELKDTQQELQRKVEQTDQQLRHLPAETAGRDEKPAAKPPTQSSDDEPQRAQRPE